MTEQEKNKYLQNGFIYRFFEWAIYAVAAISLVEWCKEFSAKFARKDDLEHIIRNKSIAIDIFILVKWLLISCFWFWGFTSFWAQAITIYLIITNFHSYFFHHVWNSFQVVKNIERAKRRFVALLLAVLFSNFSFAYLFSTPYKDSFKWSGSDSQFFQSIQLSFSNSLTGSNTWVSPENEFGQIILLIQLLVSFGFISIILSNSIPNAEKE